MHNYQSRLPKPQLHPQSASTLHWNRHLSGCWQNLFHLLHGRWNVYLMKFKTDKVLYFGIALTDHEPSATHQQRVFKSKGVLTFSHFLFPLTCFMTFESNATRKFKISNVRQVKMM